jgi:hypothetical protein
MWLAATRVFCHGERSDAIHDFQAVRNKSCIC